MTDLRSSFEEEMRAALQDRDRLAAELRAALPGQHLPWREWEDTWSAVELSATREIVTKRKLTLVRRDTPSRDHAFPAPRFIIEATRWNRHGQPCDEASFTDTAEAIAWVEMPRSADTIGERASAEAARRDAERGKVSLAGLTGERVTVGRNGKGELFQLVDFTGIGRVRITHLPAGAYRVAHQRRTLTVHREGNAADTAKAMRSAIEQLSGRS